MDFQGKVAVITGGANGIGKEICRQFSDLGAAVCMIDKEPNDSFTGDIGEQEVLERFVKKVLAEHGSIDYLIHNACLSKGGIEDCSYEAFNYVLRVGVSAPFYLTKLFAPYFREGGAVVNISSTRAGMSQPDTESYSAAKGGIGALTHALAMSLSGRVRVNSISPGWIDCRESELSGADMAQHPVKRVGKPADIAKAVLFLCGEESGFITGQDLVIDGGMTKQMIYDGDHGWHYEQER